ncbi:MAG TPA: mechanosensitive ion channel family protein [Terriglobales bacterium]|nr:mechanosensitive ion channel family protein [Terriglobales bacterium]
MIHLLSQVLLPEAADLPELLRGWRDDGMAFLRHSLPKIVLVVVVAFVLARLLRFVTNKIASLQSHKLRRGISAKQVRTLASVITSIGVFIIVFVAALEVLPLFGFELGPLLASAGVAGLAIGFGAQTLVKDFINGFFILLENQYDIGDKIRIAGVQGVVEDMTLRRTVLRDDDGTVHTVPNSNITIVSNTTRDWSKLAMRIMVAYSEPSDKIMGLLQQIADAIRHDPAFASDIVADIELPGIDRVGGGEAEYLMLVKTRPLKQFAVSRELRRRIKESFEKNNVKTALPGRVYVPDQSGAQAS